MAKIRITLKDPKDHTQVKDRLVEFATEMAMGPKDNHNGPIRIDCEVSTSDEVEALIHYLKQLTGKLPINEKPAAKTPKTTSLEENSMNRIIELVKSKPNQDEVINYLREMNFAFVSFDHLKDICEKNNWQFNLKKESHQEYQYMVRVMRLAKDPKNDKIDPTLYVGFKLFGKRAPGFLLYTSGQFKEAIKMNWASDKEINFKVKEKFYKFPEPMSYEERAKWRAEDRKVVNSDGAYEGTPFYLKWKPFVTILKPLPKKKKKQG